VAPSQSAKEKALSQAAQSIAVPSAPVKITLTPNPPNPTTNQNVHFTVTCNQPGLLAKYYSFDWGDGKSSPAFQGSSNQPESDHSYSTPASYTVTATVRGICNDREIASSVSTVVTVSQRQDNPVPLPTPTLRLERPLHPQVGYPITLVADIDASVGPPEFHFYFGDGKDEESKRATGSSTSTLTPAPITHTSSPYLATEMLKKGASPLIWWSVRAKRFPSHNIVLHS